MLWWLEGRQEEVEVNIEGKGGRVGGVVIRREGGREGRPRKLIYNWCLILPQGR